MTLLQIVYEQIRNSKAPKPLDIGFVRLYVLMTHRKRNMNVSSRLPQAPCAIRREGAFRGMLGKAELSSGLLLPGAWYPTFI